MKNDQNYITLITIKPAATITAPPIKKRIDQPPKSSTNFFIFYPQELTINFRLCFTFISSTLNVYDLFFASQSTITVCPS